MLSREERRLSPRRPPAKLKTTSRSQMRTFPVLPVTLLVVVSFAICSVSLVCAQKYEVPPAILEALSPRGLRVSIPDSPGVELFAFHGSVNKPMHALEAGDLSVDIVRKTGNRWVYLNDRVRLKRGDTIYYWTYVQADGLGYRRDDQTWQVKEFVNASSPIGSDNTVGPRNTGNAGGSDNNGTTDNNEACGIASPVGPLIALGSPANLDILPWHVGIYLKPNNTHICGGSLVRSNLVISAAHCFHNSNDVLLEKSSFILATGKLARSFKDVEPDQQVSEITSLVVAERYRGSGRRYEHDIAFVVVNFKLNSVVRPVCVDWSGRALPPLSEGDVGLVAGWGLTENGVYSERLLFARMPYIPLNQCERVVPKSFFPFITADKFCAGEVNGATVKQGDSGGGLMFQHQEPGSQNGRQWYLRGVVSVGAPSELTYSAFVDVSNFLPTMRDKL